MRVYILLVGILSIAAAATAQQEESLDLTSLVGQVDEVGLATTDSVAALQKRAEGLVAQGNCQEAIPVLEQWAKSANQLANFLRQGLEPFYDASRDDRESFARSSSGNMKEYIAYEGQANGYLLQRNRAMVLQAECQAATGNSKLAASIYYRALDLIGIQQEERESWNRARTGLYELIGVID